MYNRLSRPLVAIAAFATLTAQAFTVNRSPDWIPATPCTMIKPGSALDFSRFGFTEGPCGKYGRIIAKGDHFEYERRPGIPLRFMGVNLCGSGCTLPRDEARQLVDNLVRFGYNTVRIHHHERHMTDPKGDGIAFDRDGLDRFDALMAACREKGVYVTTDLFVSRRIPWRSIGEPRAGSPRHFKVLMHFHEGAKSNYLAFARNLLNHVNPYTKLRYAEDPTLAWISLVNEGNICNWDIKPFKMYEHLVLPKWRAWLARRRASDPEYSKIPDTLPPAVVEIPKDDRVVAFTEKLAANAEKMSAKSHVMAFQHFLASIEGEFFDEMKRVLRDELGCRALLTNMNAMRFIAAGELVRNKFDYVDYHYYYAHPNFLGPRLTLPARISRNGSTNIRNVDEFGVPYGITRRIFGHPFTISEYNYCPPWKNRSACAFLSGVTAAMQGWSALWRFCWTCSGAGAVDSARKGLNNFDMAGDPCATATERAVFCLFMRRDMSELDAMYPNHFPPSEVKKLGWKTKDLTRTSFGWVAYRAKVGEIVAEELPKGVKCFKRYSTTMPEKTRREIYEDMGLRPGDTVSSVDGAVKVDRKKGTITVDTPRTAGGFQEGTGMVETSRLRADVHGPHTAVWVSSLDSRPIEGTDRLLLVLIGDVQNDGIEYEDESRNVLRRWGKQVGRIAMRTSADVSIGLMPARWKVYALKPDGARKREIAGRFVDGRLVFCADTAGDPNEAEFYYEIVAEKNP